MTSSLSRRAVLAGTAALLAVPAKSAGKLKVAIFSKHLQYLQGEALAKGAAEIGFDAVDITVRKGGHIAPENVREELPKLVALIRQHGLEVPMITTDIVDASTPHAEEILKTMAELGIRQYRWGGFRYQKGTPFAAQLDAIKPRIAALAALNKRYQVCAMYHTHSGVNLVGAPIWDLYILLKDFDPQAVAVNYDVGHATIEGGLGGWIDSFHIIGPYLHGIAVKDYLWAKDPRRGWRERWVPLGEGMVRFPEFFKMVADVNFSGPLQMHFEYPLTPETSAPAMKRDLARLREYLAQANL